MLYTKNNILDAFKVSGFNVENVPFLVEKKPDLLHGSGFEEFKQNLFAAIKSIIPTRVPLGEFPFLLSIEDFSHDTNGTFCLSGRIKSGHVCVGDVMNIAGAGHQDRYTVSSIKMGFRNISLKNVEAAEAGDFIQVLFEEPAKREYSSNHVLVKSSCEMKRSFEALLYLPNHYAGRQYEPIQLQNVEALQFYCGKIENCYLTPQAAEFIGSTIMHVSIKLPKSYVLNAFQPFKVCGNSRRAYGIILP